MKDYLYCIVCLMWDVLYRAVLRLDSDAIFDGHPVWNLQPSRIIDEYIIKED